MQAVSPRGGLAVLLVALFEVAGCARDEPPSTIQVSPSELQARLERADAHLAEAARQEALELRKSGEPVAWESPATGIGGAVTPASTFRTSTGYYCRRYRETIVTPREGSVFTVAAACRDDAGICRNVEF